MKIRCIVPNTSPALRDGLVAERRQAAGPGVIVDVVNIRDSSISLETVYEEMLAGPGILEQVARAEEEGCSGS